jgi:hypothetical protein
MSLTESFILGEKINIKNQTDKIEVKIYYFAFFQQSPYFCQSILTA